MLFRKVSARWRALVRALVTLFLYDVFISYARRDGRRYARAMHRRLENYGIITFLDRSDLFAGEALTPALAKALRKSRLLVLVATEGAGRSTHVRLEVETYLTSGRLVVPVDFAGSYEKSDWPALRQRNPVWLSESAEAIERGPSGEVLAGIRRHLRSAGSRVRARRVIAAVLAVVTILIGGLFWASARADDRARQRDAQQLSARAALAFDADHNPLLGLAFGVAALARHESVEAAEVLARVLPFARRPLGDQKIGRLADRVQYSAGGRYLLARGRLDVPGQVLAVLTTKDMQSVLRLERPGIGAAETSPDERHLAVVDRPDCVSVLEMPGGRIVTCLPHGNVFRVEFSADGQLLSTTSRGERAPGHVVDTVKVWTIGTWAGISQLDAPAGTESVRFSSDGRYIAMGLQAAHVGEPIACIWTIDARGPCSPVAELDEPLRRGRLWESATVQFSRDGRSLLVAETRRVRVLDTASGRELQRFADSTGFERVQWAPNGNAVLAANATGLVSVYATNASDSSPVAQLAHPNRILDLAISLDGKNIVTAAEDGVVRVWDAGLADLDRNDFFQSTRLSGLATNGENLTSFTRSRLQVVSSLAIAPDAASFATAGDDGWIRVWRMQPEPEVGWSRHGQGVTAVAATPIGNTFVSASEYSGRIWGLNPLRELARLGRHDNDLTGAAITHDGSMAMTAGSDGAVLLWDAHDFHLLRRILHDPQAERSVRAALSEDGSLLATTSSDRVVRLWRPSDGSLLSQHLFGEAINALALSASGARVAIATSTTATILEIPTWVEHRRLEHASVVRALTFDHSGSRLVSGSEDGSVVVWSVSNGARGWTAQHVGRVTAAHFSADERVIATGAHDRTVRTWDAGNGNELARQSLAFRVDAVQFVNNGGSIVAGGENYVHVSPWKATDLTSIACHVLGAIDAASRTRLLGDVAPGVCTQDQR